MTFSASQPDFEPGSLSRSGFHLQAGADQIRALADTQQAEVTAGREVGGALRHVEADAVIAHLQLGFLLSK